MGRLSAVRTFAGNIFRPLGGFTNVERRDTILYITGTCLLKFGVDAFSGSIISYAVELFANRGSTFNQLGLLQAVALAIRCLGSILILPFLKKIPIRWILSLACFWLGLSTAAILIMDSATGGQFKTKKPGNKGKYGGFNPLLLTPLYSLYNFGGGMIDIVRVMIPRDIARGHVKKIRKVDPLISCFYSMTAIASSAVTALLLIPQLGNNRAFITSPISFCVAGISYFLMSDLSCQRAHAESDGGFRPREAIVDFFRGLGRVARSVFHGGKMLLTEPSLWWLLPAYSLSCYGHRYIEAGLIPLISKRFLGQPSWTLLITPGPSIRELLGSLTSLGNSGSRTPRTWVIIDALSFGLLWVIPFWYPPTYDLSQVWYIALLLIPVSFGASAAAGRRNAYIQSEVLRLCSDKTAAERLRSVRGITCSLYVVEVAFYTIMRRALLDRIHDQTTEDQVLHLRMRWTVGLHFTLVGAFVLSSTAFMGWKSGDHDAGGTRSTPDHESINNTPDETNEDRSSGEEGIDSADETIEQPSGDREGGDEVDMMSDINIEDAMMGLA